MDEALYKQPIPHSTTRRYGQFVRHVANGRKVSKLIQNKVDPAFPSAAALVGGLGQKLVLLADNQGSNGVKGSFSSGRMIKSACFFCSHICKTKITLVRNGINGLGSKEPQSG